LPLSDITGIIKRNTRFHLNCQGIVSGYSVNTQEITVMRKPERRFVSSCGLPDKCRILKGFIFITVSMDHECCSHTMADMPGSIILYLTVLFMMITG
jgi:hypothetical protein